MARPIRLSYSTDSGWRCGEPAGPELGRSGRNRLDLGRECVINPRIDETDSGRCVIRVAVVEARGDAEGIERDHANVAVGVRHESRSWCWGGVGVNERPNLEDATVDLGGVYDSCRVVGG